MGSQKRTLRDYRQALIDAYYDAMDARDAGSPIRRRSSNGSRGI
jgi:hypothetical protein